MKIDYSIILRRFNLKDTQSRRLVLAALAAFQKPITQKDIYAWLKKKKMTTNLVTIYRTLETFTELGIVHKHPSTGGYLLCSMEGKSGHHSFLSCEECGKVEEFCNDSFCSKEKHIAAEAGFTPKQHLSEIIGVCSSCS